MLHQSKAMLGDPWSRCLSGVGAFVPKAVDVDVPTAAGRGPFGHTAAPTSAICPPRVMNHSPPASASAHGRTGGSARIQQPVPWSSTAEDDLLLGSCALPNGMQSRLAAP